MSLQNIPEKFDGFYFTSTVNDDEEDDISVMFFNHDESEEHIKNSEGKNFYHVVMFDGEEYDCEYEAIFYDPFVYLRNLIGTNTYGCFLKKSKTSREWVQEFVKNAKITMEKLKNGEIVLN